MDVISITCYTKGCGYSPFPMERGFYNRARRTHEWWHCPAGHSQHFVGETDEQIQHRKEVDRLKRQMDNWETWYERERDLARTCPWPTCREFVYASRESLYDHMRRLHGMPLLAAVRDAS